MISVRPSKFCSKALLPTILLFVDAVLILVAWPLSDAGAEPRRYWAHPDIFLLLPGLCFLFATQGHYTKRDSFSTEAAQVVLWVLLIALLDYCESGLIVRFWVIVLLTLVMGRAAVRWVLFQFSWTRVPVLIIGTEATRAAVRLATYGNWYRGFEIQEEIVREAVYSAIAPTLIKLAAAGQIKGVVLATDTVTLDALAVRNLARDFGLTVSVILSPSPYGRRLVVDQFFGNNLFLIGKMSSWCPWPNHRIKRNIDLVLSALILVLLAPVFVLIACLVRRDGGPVFYASPRLGRRGETFHALKFRTMVLDADKALQNLISLDERARHEWETTFKIRNDHRITPVGRLLRRFSLDELPQIINVLRGEMSLVGPRPLLLAEREAYGEAFELYCTCTPGITGPWQVSGRNNLDYQQRIELNSWYAKHASLWIDIVILVRTVSVVFRQVGAI